MGISNKIVISSKIGLHEDMEEGKTIELREGAAGSGRFIFLFTSLLL